MDPLSTTGSIIAAIQLTTSVIHYLDDVKGAVEDYKRIRSVICSANEILCIPTSKSAAARAGDPWSQTLQSLFLPDGPLRHYEMTLQRIEHKMRHTQGPKKVIKIVTWPFQKKEVNELLDHLEHQKTLFLLAQQNDHMWVTENLNYLP